MDPARLNWMSARVEDAELAVELDGDVPKGWKGHFKTTVRLLGGGEWGEIELKKHTVYVSDVSAGAEQKLRHHLEGVVEQANAAVASEREEQEPADEDERPRPDPDVGDDARMTEVFRSFAPDEGVEG